MLKIRSKGQGHIVMIKVIVSHYVASMLLLRSHSYAQSRPMLLLPVGDCMSIWLHMFLVMAASTVISMNASHCAVISHFSAITYSHSKNAEMPQCRW